MNIQRNGKLRVPYTKSSLKIGKIYQMDTSFDPNTLFLCIGLRSHKYLVRLDNNQAFSVRSYESTDRFYEVNHTLIIED